MLGPLARLLSEGEHGCFPFVADQLRPGLYQRPDIRQPCSSLSILRLYKLLTPGPMALVGHPQLERDERIVLGRKRRTAMPVTDRRLDSYKARPWHCVLKGKGTRGIKTRGKDIEFVGVKITQAPSLDLSTSEAAYRAKSTQRAWNAACANVDATSSSNSSRGFSRYGHIPISAPEVL